MIRLTFKAEHHLRIKVNNGVTVFGLVSLPILLYKGVFDLYIQSLASCNHAQTYNYGWY